MSIAPSDIIGARITEIWEKRETTSDGIEICHVYLKADRGFYFQLPSVDYPWEKDSLPAAAKLLGSTSRSAGWLSWLRSAREFDRAMGALRSSPIARVLTNDDPPDDSVIVLADGAQIWCRTVCPVGIGTGLIYTENAAQKLDLSGYRNFWDASTPTAGAE